MLKYAVLPIQLSKYWRRTNSTSISTILIDSMEGHNMRQMVRRTFKFGKFCVMHLVNVYKGDNTFNKLPG